MKRSELFFSKKAGAEILTDLQDEPEIIGCLYGGRNCMKKLAVINKHFLRSVKFQRGKKYHLAIEFLKSAYHKTDELNESTCARCIELFKAPILDSMTDLYQELDKMTKGIFRNKRYNDVFAEAENTLREFQESNQ